MIVTIKAPTSASARVGLFEAIKCGLDCTYMEGDILNLVVTDLNRATRLSDKIGGTVVAVVDRMEWK